MKKTIVRLLDGSYTIPLQVHDSGSITHGQRHHEVVIQIEQQADHLSFLLENRYKAERKWFTISHEEWRRLYYAPDWQHSSWSPFTAYERITPRGKATLTRRADPLLRERHDVISSEFWQARLYLAQGILTTFTEFSCPAGQDDAFCKASEWTVRMEQGTDNPAYTISSLVKEKPQRFRMTEGFATIDSLWRECSVHEIAQMMAQYTQSNGHSTILVRDLPTLKALLPNTKVAGAHSPTGLPVH